MGYQGGLFMIPRKPNFKLNKLVDNIKKMVFLVILPIANTFWNLISINN